MRPPCYTAGECSSSCTLESMAAESGPAVSECGCSNADIKYNRAILLPTGQPPRRLFFRLKPGKKHRGHKGLQRAQRKKAMPIEVGILGATGMVGQQFIALLANHPWFKVRWLGASERSAGKPYRDACAWRLPVPLAADVAEMQVNQAGPSDAPKLVFSGLDSSVAGDIEAAFARAGHVIVSNSRNHRMEPTVPLLIPEVNAD